MIGPTGRDRWMDANRIRLRRKPSREEAGLAADHFADRHLHRHHLAATINAGDAGVAAMICGAGAVWRDAALSSAAEVMTSTSAATAQRMSVERSGIIRAPESFLA
ncbi:hypothetical protein [Afipia sp. P52-10]|uniref:hypothetical protein n=1 Tax=Afipia sp. P52-10 TaxID=1429916 RepID=UPI001267974E|nr:hypothetical protein [Afipia sp. P52-10]